MKFEEYLASLQNKTVAVIGIGVSNRPLIELLLSRGVAVTACDKKDRAALGAIGDELEAKGARLRLGPDYLKDLTEDVIFRTNRAYLHVILHCMLRHLAKKRGKVPELWDLACDVAVESILDGLDYPCLSEGTVPAKQKFYGECRRDMPVLTAEGIYRRLLRLSLPEYEVAQLQRRFLEDDHGLWDPEKQDDQQQSQQQDEKWRDLSEKTQTGMETVLAGQATGGEAVLEQIQVANRDDVDYRAFLRRFAVPREVLGVDGEHHTYCHPHRA